MTRSAGPVVFWGATGQSKVMRECVERLGYQLIAIFDSNTALKPPFDDVPLVGGWTEFGAWVSQQSPKPGCLVTIGGHRGKDRLSIQEDLVRAGLPTVTAVHPAAFVARGAEIGEGGQVHALAHVGVGTSLGAACIVNSSAVVDHECELGNGVHICPGAKLAGLVTVGDWATVGTGAIVLPRIRIGKGAMVGAGAVVTKDVADYQTVVGNPARLLGSDRSNSEFADLSLGM